MWFVDYWWIVIPGALLGLYAQFKLSATYNHYARVPTDSGVTGAEAAREILNAAGLYNVPVTEVAGHLTDHYNPLKKELMLSPENYHGNSLAAVGVAAHDAGHALQHKAAYAPLHIRVAIVPLTQVATVAWQFILILGLFMGLFWQLLPFAIVIFAVISLFQIITLPVEYDASRRAKAELVRIGLIHSDEAQGVAKVLNTAALTYVAAMVSAVLQLLQFLLLARGRDEA